MSDYKQFYYVKVTETINLINVIVNFQWKHIFSCEPTSMWEN